MRQKPSRSLIDLWRRTPPATARLLGEATQHDRPARALLVLLAVTALGAGGYVAGTTITDPASDRTAESAGPTATYGGGRPEPALGAPTFDAPTPGGRSAEPSASAIGQSEAPSPTAATTPTPPLRSTSATGSPSTGATTPSTSQSTSPSPTGATASASPKDTAPPQTSISEDFPGPDAALLTFSANEPATFTCSLDDAAYTSCDSPLLYLDLAAGWHILAVRATDTAGNTDQTPAESSWHSDKGGAGD